MGCKLALWWKPIAIATMVVTGMASGPAAAQSTRPAGKPTDAPTPAKGSVSAKKPAADAPLFKTAALDAESPPARVAAPDADPSPMKASAPAPVEPAPAEGAVTGKAAEEPLVPVPQEFRPVEVEAASFKGVTPGATTMTDVEKAWGAPKEVNKRDGVLVQLFAVEPFDRVEVSYFEEKVTSLVIRFNKSFPADAVAKQLELSNVRPVLVSNEMGEILGQVYPERGVLFAFEAGEDAKKPSMKVEHIILEPISAEPFVLRAETNLESQSKTSLLDLEQALKLQPNNARALWLQGRALTATGEYEKALASSTEAIRLESDNARYRVTRAQILGQMGRLPEAIQEAQKAVEAGKGRPHVQARALCLLGDLTASGAKPDYKQAVRFHMEAVKTAEPLSSDRHPAVRAAAKEVLIDAHVGAAHDIAWGDWKDKGPAVTRWLSRASALADDLVKNEGSNEEQRFRVNTRALAACVGLRGAVDPADWAKEAVRSGEELINTTRDSVRKAQFQWDLGMALYDALQVYQMRHDHDTALKYGEWAIDYLEQGDRQKQSPTTAYLLGRLYFRLGAIHAIRDQNHRAAITWFEKAIPLLERPVPKEALADLGRHGETFVSMGVSFWETGQRDKAVELTQRGVKLMEQAVKQGSLTESALAIPYSNLSAMHRQLGADSAAARYQEMAGRIKKTKTQ